MADAMNAGPLAGKIALVTGASRGICAACAVALGKTRAEVILTGRDTDLLANAVARITDMGEWRPPCTPT